ncbi:MULTISPECIES: RNA polymerase sigma factor [unclassified Spirosoma]|uniref:RNA polymerase sigma factor n=1 Tax=unclassified Spirosoma TaxID=2621999 RepID=UPI0009635A8D|nr:MULTISPECIES: RNA polymerase sigma factor [unclassified Spirosoma]MBN8822848.1 RNA polymerase sigma factor [Spirosoma sp.]OJW80044.1 MAG: RNA polymerase subunit sigma-24 [Spirosoma sp. 48-14]
MANLLEQTFLEHINGHLGIAHKVCRLYCQDPEERVDLIQEMLYQLWKSYPAFGGRSSFTTWMYRVCLNTALTWRKKATRTSWESLSISHQQIPEQPADPNEEQRQSLYRAIATLSPLNKAIVLLYLDEVNYEEIADITGLSKSNVSVRLVRIKKELEIQLKKQADFPYNVNT